MAFMLDCRSRLALRLLGMAAGRLPDRPMSSAACASPASSLRWSGPADCVGAVHRDVEQCEL